MEIDQVETFVAIVRRGGFTRAAVALHLSQPAVSRRLDLLEREIGRALFDRTRGGARLTEAGRALLPHAEALLASMRDGMEAVRALEHTDRGSVTVALVGTLASTALTARLQRFRRAHPDVRLALRTALSREVSALVRRGDAVLGLRYFPDPDPDLVSVRLYEEPLVTVCAPTHRLASARRPTAALLAGETWVAFPQRPGSSGESYAQLLAQRLAALGLGEAEIVPIDSLTAQKRLVEAGFGLGLMPASAVEEELRLGTLRALEIAAMRAAVPVVLVHRRRAYLSGAARALMALLTEAEIRPGPAATESSSSRAGAGGPGRGRGPTRRRADRRSSPPAR
ncbi:MAG TPA: LysR family transcriptional regulator [Methylomirabilota bacterium]|jgi:DNA-binding transcriptional LysR family regulator